MLHRFSPEGLLLFVSNVTSALITIFVYIVDVLHKNPGIINTSPHILLIFFPLVLIIEFLLYFHGGLFRRVYPQRIYPYTNIPPPVIHHLTCDDDRMLGG
jgi:hypothetical protein